jgi:hypothetical protein
VALGGPQRAGAPILALLPAALLLVAGTALAQPEQALLVPMPPDFALAWKQDKPDGSQALLGRWTQGVLAACPNAQVSRAPQSPVS